MSDTPKHLFELGRIVATPGVLEAFEKAGESALPYIIRHVTGDWGDLDPEDKQANLRGVMYGDRILSAYHLSTGVKVWVITEADERDEDERALGLAERRSHTTFLLPEEY